MPMGRFVGASGMLVAALACLTPAARAQAHDLDTGEVAVLGGIGLGGGLQPALESSAGARFSRYGMGLFTFSFTPMGQNTIQPWPSRSSIVGSNLYDFGTDFHITIPAGERWSPYAIAGVGLLWNAIHANTVSAAGLATVTHYDQFNAALHTGAGLRYYVGKNWGVRPELRVVVSKRIYTQFLVGLFYVTPPEWP